MANRMFPHAALLYSVTGKTADENGTAYLIAPSKSDELNSQDQEFRAWIVITTTGGTSPTADVIIQTSHDGTNWTTWCQATQVTSATTQAELKAASALDLGRYVRARLDVGGTAVPTTAVTVYLCSNGKFTATAA